MSYTDNRANPDLSLFLEPTIVKTQFKISDQELKQFGEFGDQCQADVDVFIEDFYTWMATLDVFSIFFNNPGTINRVKNQQIQYWHEFFKGEITATYLKNRVHVGAVHAEIGLPIHSYCAAMNFSAEWWKTKIEEHRKKGMLGNTPTECAESAFALFKTFNKLVYLDTTIVTETYHQNTQKKLRKTLEETQKIVHDVTNIAESVVKGDYSTKLSEDSVLNSAINKMIASLNQSSIESKRDAWIKTGQAQLSEKLRGDQDLTSLCSNAVEFLTKYLNAKVGVFYLLENNNKLKLMGSYAYQHRKNLSNEFEIGQGLLGQAILEKQTMIVDNLPEGYLSVSSGLGEAPSASTLVCPILLEGKVTAVMELGTFGKFEEISLELLKVVNDTIASFIESARNREKMNVLLEDSQKKSSAMEKQSKELELINKDLAEQAQKIKKSEEELKTQSEELQATNEELEEKTQALEEQKRDMERQNRDLARSQTLLQEKAKELQNSSRYKSEFLSNMSHELRTPLNSLLILAQSLTENDEGNLTQEQVQTANIIYSSGKDLLNLINDILDVSKVEAGKLHVELTKFNPKKLVDDLCLQLNSLAGKNNVKLTVELEKDAPKMITSDTMRVEQILKNLLSNAVKFSNKNGKVIVRIGKAEKNKVYLQDALLQDDIISFSVEDNGIGIADEDKISIFEAFQQADGTTSRKYGGTGLGLTISRQLAELLGGEIHLKSKLGEGSTFTLLLPVNGPINQSIESSFKHHRVARNGNISVKKTKRSKPLILIIEDDKNFNQIIQSHLSNRKIEFISVGTGEEGLQKAKTENPTAIILDINLPDMNGFDLLDKLDQDTETKHIPVHVISVDDVKEMALKKGAIGFINKPLSREKLEKLLSDASRIIQEPVQNILIVEDDKIQRNAIRKMILSDNHNVLEAENASEAEKLLLSTRVHCMILDLKLPDMTGKELLDRLSQNKKITLPAIIIYTARDITPDEERALNEYTPSIVLKSADSSQRLLDEVNLFLKKMENEDLDFPKMTSNFQDIKGRKILLVDDDMRNNIALGSYLRKHGFEIVTADNGELALQRLDEDKSIDLILMDIMMPIMDGYTTMRSIREKTEYQSLPIIALTAKAMADDRNKCIQAGANDYLTKPVDMDKLFSVMRVWLNK